MRGEQAGGVPQPLGPRLQATGGGRPSTGEPCCEQLMRRGYVGPDGDRRQGSESRGVVHQMQRVAVGDDDVVRVLVLGHDLWPAWRQVMGATPVQYVAEGALFGSE